MKFYFDGDSCTYGSGLKKIGVVPEDVRWSKLVCDYFGAEEINLSSNGASNDKIMRQLFGESTIEIYDFYFLQTTFSNRYEFYDTNKKKWMTYSYSFLEDKCVQRWGSIEGLKFAQWMKFGRNRIYSDLHERTRENITYNALKSYVTSVGRAKRSFFSTAMKPQHTPNKYDLSFSRGNKLSSQQLIFDRIPIDGHASVEGHKTIAKYVIDIVNKRL